MSKNKFVVILGLILIILFAVNFIDSSEFIILLILLFGYKLIDYYKAAIVLTIICIGVLPMVVIINIEYIECWGYVVFYLFSVLAVASAKNIIYKNK